MGDGALGGLRQVQEPTLERRETREERQSPMICGIYARVSTRDGRQDVSNQLLQLHQFAAKQGWTVLPEHVYIDHETGKTSDRDQFQRMFQDAAQRRFDILLFWALDRLSREGAYQTLTHLNWLTSYGIAWRSFTEQYLDSTGLFRDAVISILAVIARQERVRISERTRAGLDRARRQGKRLGRPRVAVPSDEVRSLRREGFSWSAISRELGIARATLQRAVVSE